jgi:hypothetical protein
VKCASEEALSIVGSVTQVRRIISVCEARDLDVWAIAAKNVIQHIEAESYHLICPDSQIPAFGQTTPRPWRITGENAFSKNCSVEMIRSRVKGQNVARVHWLYQQFLKINAIVDSDLDDDAIVVIWDADTVPLRKIRFAESDSGRLLVYPGAERHSPYFETIGSLLGNGSIADFSFISQCLPVRAGWVRGLVREIESRSGVSYVEEVLRIIPGVSGSEFSEYETIGTWIWRHHREGIVIREDKLWLRNGATLFGGHTKGWRAEALLFLLSYRYDFVAIEKWSRPLSLGRIFSFLSRKLGFRK